MKRLNVAQQVEIVQNNDFENFKQLCNKQKPARKAQKKIIELKRVEMFCYFSKIFQLCNEAQDFMLEQKSFLFIREYCQTQKLSPKIKTKFEQLNVDDCLLFDLAQIELYELGYRKTLLKEVINRGFGKNMQNLILDNQDYEMIYAHIYYNPLCPQAQIKMIELDNLALFKFYTSRYQLQCEAQIKIIKYKNNVYFNVYIKSHDFCSIAEHEMEQFGNGKQLNLYSRKIRKENLHRHWW